MRYHQTFTRMPHTTPHPHSVFTSTAIDYLLQNLGIASLVLCGMIANQCVESSARDAAGLGYAVTMAADATTANSPEDQTAAEEVDALASSVSCHVTCRVVSCGVWCGVERPGRASPLSVG